MEATNSQYIEECRMMIQLAKTDEALSKLINSVSKYQNELIGLMGKWNALKRDRSLGLIDDDKFRMERDKMNAGILNFLRELELEKEVITSLGGKLSGNKIILKKRKYKYILISSIVAAILVVVSGLYWKSGHPEDGNSSDMQNPLRSEYKEIKKLKQGGDLYGAIRLSEKFLSNADNLNQREIIDVKRIQIDCYFLIYDENSIDENLTKLMGVIEENKTEEPEIKDYAIQMEELINLHYID